MKPDRNYINGIIFSAHKNLISRDKMLRIADTASAEEAFSAVKEHGYQVAELGAGDYQTALFTRNKSCWTLSAAVTSAKI